MLENVTSQIEAAEEQLRLAMLASDVEALDSLISPNLVFTTHSGAVITKEDDLEIYRSGTLKFQKIELSEQRILALGNVAYVSVLARLSGVFGGSAFQDEIRFSRVWQLSPNNAWRVIAGQATVVQA
jgi:ketosteroid isomerase-like protein